MSALKCDEVFELNQAYFPSYSHRKAFEKKYHVQRDADPSPQIKCDKRIRFQFIYTCIPVYAAG